MKGVSLANLAKSIRGMNDSLPIDTPEWRAVEGHIVSVLQCYGYQEIRLPMLEQTSVFHRSIGDETDIVQKEMYSFDDRNGDSLTLRPEGTASCVRAVLQNSLLQNVPQRLWYMGPMFRHERPQRGRLRQFHQVGIEVFGAESPQSDAELIMLTSRLWDALSIQNVRLEVNSLGNEESRANYTAALVNYFSPFKKLLDEPSLARLNSNPLRILDSKNPGLKDLISGAPLLSEYLDRDSKAHFTSFEQTLSANNIKYTINPKLVRGLDYYNKTVFEWVTDELGAQSAICAGGRYDSLVETMGGKPSPATGCAMGLERIIELRKVQQNTVLPQIPDVYVIATDDNYELLAIQAAEYLRSHMPSLKTVLHVNGGKLKARMKKADRAGARVAILIGANEAEAKKVTIKPLRTNDQQITCDEHELKEILREMLITNS
jgi:histidyl-tRNA synthetase